MFGKSLTIRKGRLGPDHADTLISMSDLALAYQAVGRVDRALPMMEEAMKLYTARLGADHPDTVNATSNLAIR